MPSDKEPHRLLGLARAADLILHLPLRYEDETRLTPFLELRPGEAAQVEGVLIYKEQQRGGRAQLLFEIEDIAGQRLRIRLLHFRPNQAAALCPGVTVRAFGEARPGLFGMEMVHPRYRVLRPSTPLPKTLTPVYPSVAALSQYRLRQAIEAELDAADLTDSLPEALRQRLGLPEFEPALRFLHHPPANADIALLEQRQGPAWARLKFDELLAQQISLQQAVAKRQHLHATPLTDPEGLCPRLLAALPFALTEAQARCLDEIRADLAAAQPMHRLLQGDVGSGKTCVAAACAALAVGTGLQAAVMAPTELLAEQLYQRFRDWFSPLGIAVVWLSSAIKGRARATTLTALTNGSAAIAVGTHALIQDDVTFARLGLVIVDEQHRFGVEQRLALRGKAGSPSETMFPHLLMMSATPIPRTLAMSYYADLAISSIDHLPPGRTPIATHVMSDARRAEVIDRLATYCGAGGQAYWVCPLIEESEKLDLKAAIDTHLELTAALPKLRIGLAHGRLKSAEKAAVMAAFKAGELDVLVATTVIEVGVDVPNASLMVIEHAERMGLAQMHQLRGRVGRGARASTCLLIYSNPIGAIARERLAILRDSQDGFEIARQDLRLRGPGERLGARQSGQQMLRFADIETDAELIEPSARAATELLRHHTHAVARHLDRWLPDGEARLYA